MNTKNKDLWGFIAAILVLFAIVAFSATASAAVINVPSAGNETIQQAINNATAGDTILVNATAYNAQGIPETVIVNKSDIIIRSVNGRAVVSASSSPDKHVFDITDQTNVTLQGFEIRDAYSTSQDVAGIYMYNASECNISDNVVTNISATDAPDAYGIYLYSSSNNNLTNNTAYSNNNFGIFLDHSSNNNLTNNTALNSKFDGIRLSYSSNYNTLTNNTASSNDYYGILLLSSSNNNTLTNNTASNNGDGILLYSSSNNNTLTNNTANSNTYGGISLDDSSSNNLTSNTASNNGDGIRLSYFSNYNTLTNNTASNNTNYDFYSDANSHDNTVKDLTVASYPTTLSFTYKNGVGLKGVETGTAPPDPAGKTNIGKYVNATNVTVNSWLFLNVSYEDVDLGGVDENSLSMWKHNGTDWTEVPGTNGTNTTENYVYANITEFGSIFAPLGKPPVNCTCGDICVNETRWWRDGGTFNLNNTPIQAAIDNATVGETICVKNGTYNESVDVTKSDLTIRSENGSSVTTVSASLSPDEHVFNISDQTNVTLEGFTTRDAYGANRDVAGIYMKNASECNISNNVVTNISATSTYTAYGVWLNASDNNIFKNISMPGGISSGGAACGLYLESSNNNSMQDATLGNITAEYLACGIMLGASNNNSIDPKIGNIESNGYALGVGLHESYMNEITSLDFGKVSGGGDEVHGIYIEDSWYNNLSLNMTSRDDIIGNGTNVSGVFMHNANFTRITGIEFGAIRNIKTGDTITYGVYMENSNDNFLDPAMGNITNEGGVSIGLGLINSSNNTVENTTLGNITAEYLACGIMLGASNNNSIDPKIGNIRSNNGFAIGVGLFESYMNEITSLDFGKVSGGGDEAHGIYIEDSWYNNLSLNMTSRDDIIGNGTNVSGVYMHNANFTRITGIEFGAIRNIKTGDTITYGIYMDNSNDNFLDPAIGNITNEGGVSIGLGLTDSSNNSFTDTTIRNVTGNYMAAGIGLSSSNNNTFDPTVIEDINGSYALGVVFMFSNSTSFTDTTIKNVTGILATGISFGILDPAGGYPLPGFSNYNNFTDTTIRNVKGNMTAGISLIASNNNTFDPTVIENVEGIEVSTGVFLFATNDTNFTDTAISSVAGYMAAGISLFASNSNTFDPTEIENVNGTYTAAGVYLNFTNNNVFSETKVHEVSSLQPENSFGFYLMESSYNNVTDGEIFNCTRGTRIDSGWYNTIERNIIRDNFDTGVLLDGSASYTEIHTNCFYNNSPQAMDDGANNNWTGNYWSDYIPPGPYNISGVAGSKDNEPLDVCPLGEGPPPNITSFAPPSPVNDTVCTWRTFNVTVNQTVNVSWYLNGTAQVTKNVSVTEANFTFHAQYIGVHNVSAVAENANGTDMQTWAWNVTAAPAAAPNITSFAPPSPVNDTICHWRTFNVTVNQTVNVSWYLNESFLHTNESVTEANYTLHAEFVGDNNVSAVATNANGTDMQTWVWNVTAAPVFGAPNITSFAPPSLVNDTICHWRTFNVTVNQTVNVSWYLNESFLFTNESVTEANYTLHAEFVGDNNVSAVATNANGTDMQTWVCNVSSLDNDGDGVSNAVEDGAPNNGDGNGDGTPDRDQSNVTSLPTATNRGYMTLVLSNCTQLKNVTALPEAPVDPEYDYPYGLVSFEIMCENGTVNITYHDAAALTGYTYRKYGPTTPGDLGTIRWYDFSTYATIAGNRVTLSFQDNRLGDGTGDDGKIVDPGGPGISGVVAQVPVLTPIGMIALVGLLSVIAAININLRKRR